METKEVKVTIPEGYEIDKENSTFECIKFKRKVVPPKFKVGDRVKIVSKESLNTYNKDVDGVWRSRDEMLDYAGRICTITRKSARNLDDGLGDDNTSYYIDIDGEYWCWRDFCFKPLSKEDEANEKLKEVYYPRVKKCYPDWGEKFCQNLEEQESCPFQKIEICIALLDRKSYAISVAFCWDSTPEGHMYWKVINDYYRTIIVK